MFIQGSHSSPGRRGFFIIWGHGSLSAKGLGGFGASGLLPDKAQTGPEPVSPRHGGNCSSVQHLLVDTQERLALGFGFLGLGLSRVWRNLFLCFATSKSNPLPLQLRHEGSFFPNPHHPLAPQTLRCPESTWPWPPSRISPRVCVPCAPSISTP